MKKMIIGFLAILLSLPTMAQTKTVSLRIIETSDVHGSFFPYDFTNHKPKDGSLARVITYVDSLRAIYGNRLILLDNGDILQGQPICYYYNYVKTEVPNIAASVVNYMHYDAETVGNHDIETGHAVYDKWFREVRCPILGANIVSTKTAQPYVHPYTIIKRNGIKIAVLGMLTDAIPNWLNEHLWSGLRFDNMVKSCRYWINYLQTHEHPNLIIGLFHSGKEGGIQNEKFDENASMEVARKVPGFDLILYGHDHTLHQDIVKNAITGKNVLCLDPSCNALYVSDAQISVTVSDETNPTTLNTKVTGQLVNVCNEKTDADFIRHFQPDIDSVKKFVDRKIGTFTHSIYTRDCYFGSAPFSDFIQDLQLKITGADISFNAPLSFDTSIRKGDIHVSDLFNLYRYENQIYTVRMTGNEIRKYLEMSYDLWANTMKSPDDHIMLLSDHHDNGAERYLFKNLAFNFDSAVGIDYTVDVTKPNGQKVHILQMSNGQPFNLKKWYKVAMNSYRGNGGGELLTKGAGIPHKELKGRIIFQSKEDQRYYLMKEIEKAGTLDPKAHDNWRFIPESWVKPAIARDKALLFGKPLTAAEEK
jgi:2',3'-cyclic-nucleotide 2'-phosphodiesterase/3'-nucleotidase